MHGQFLEGSRGCTGRFQALGPLVEDATGFFWAGEGGSLHVNINPYIVF